MRLVRLSSDRQSFRTLDFRPTGVTLVVGDAAKEEPDEGSSNGVGKTLALGLVHHCLGAKSSKTIRTAVPDWHFTLEFVVNGKAHQVERSGDSKVIALDEKAISLASLQSWLNDCGAFRLDTTLPGLSFRSLFARFARHQRADCDDPVQLAKESPADALLRSLYLLGTDVDLVVSKRAHKLEKDYLSATAKAWQQDPVMRDLFQVGAKPKVRSEHLAREAAALRGRLSEFQVAEDYRAIELQAGSLTTRLREIEQAQAVLRFQLDGIHASLETRPDIGREELLSLYEGLGQVFRAEALAHFEAVEAFHLQLAANRAKRLQQDQLRLRRDLLVLEQERVRIADERDARLQLLSGKRALDEYAALAKEVARVEEEKRRIDQHMELTTGLEMRAREIRQLQAQEPESVTPEPATA